MLAIVWKLLRHWPGTRAALPGTGAVEHRSLMPLSGLRAQGQPEFW